MLGHIYNCFYDYIWSQIVLSCKNTLVLLIYKMIGTLTQQSSTLFHGMSRHAWIKTHPGHTWPTFDTARKQCSNKCLINFKSKCRH